MILRSTLTRFAHAYVALFLLLTGALESKAATLTASSLVTAKSFYLGESTSTAGYKIYFNSYDGVQGYSRSQTVHCGEALRYNNGIFSYVSDYDIYAYGRSPYDGPYNPVGYGTISFAIPTTDSDNDGLIDFLDISRYINQTITGSITEHITGIGSRTYTASCSFVKGTNTGIGEFTFTSSAGTATISGFYEVQHGTATVSYDTDAKTIKFTGPSFGYGSPFSSDSLGTATATYQILSPTSIKVNAFTYSDAYYTKQINSFTMTRSGNKFIATGSMQDGDTYSSWADYKDFVLTITDNNDTDTDGIPDLSDDLIFLGPTITVPPPNASVISGGTTNISVTATSLYSMTYQWYLNGAPLEGKTAATLTLTNMQPEQAGNYTVVVSSNGKSKTSQAASVTVLIAPQVTLSPASVIRLPGGTLELTATATGIPSPTYEWYRNDILLPGATGAILWFGPTLSDSGIYTVKAINTVGSAVSNPAKVVITRGIFSTSRSITGESIRSNGFPLTVNVEAFRSYRIEYSSDMVTWATLISYPNVNHRSIEFTDATVTTNSQRFYRLVDQ